MHEHKRKVISIISQDGLSIVLIYSLLVLNDIVEHRNRRR